MTKAIQSRFLTLLLAAALLSSAACIEYPVERGVSISPAPEPAVAEFSAPEPAVAEAAAPLPAVAEPIHVEYGINCDSFEVVKDVVSRNQSLSQILSAYEVAYSHILALVQKSRDIFDVRSIRAGGTYCVIRSKQPADHPGDDAAYSAKAEVKYFVYEQNPVDYVVFKLGESPDVFRASKPVEFKERCAAGVVETSLGESLNSQEVGYELALQLSEIFAWEVDFHHLQKGDSFKIIYQEKYVEGERVGLGDITSAVIVHNERPYYAFLFEQDGSRAYFDENGDSLQKAFLKAPIKYSRITSGFKRRRLHPVLNKYKPHFGIDYAAKSGTPIMSVGDGRVLKAHYDKHNGKYVKIKHNATYTTQYLHMSKFAKGIKPGVQIKQGDLIGYVGSTGLATGPHLCFRFWKNGRQVDPYKEEIPSVAPVKKENKERFNRTMSALERQLDSLPDGSLAALSFAKDG